MRKYVNDLKDLWHGKTCPNDYNLFYTFLLILPDYIIATLFVILLSLFFKPTICKASTTYYDWEKIEVDSLPEASDSTLVKVYIVEGKYYITESETTVGRLYVGLDVCNLGVSVSIPSDVEDIIQTTNGEVVLATAGNSSVGVRNLVLFKDSTNTYIKFFNYQVYNRQENINVSDVSISCNTWTVNHGGIIVTSINTSNDDYSILNWFSIPDSGSTIYSWVEERKYDVYDSMFTGSDFPLFFDFSDIKEFSILSSYDLDNLNDFQKIVLLLGFNMFFLGFIGFIIYILIKLINKGVSVIFR